MLLSLSYIVIPPPAFSVIDQNNCVGSNLPEQTFIKAEEIEND